MFVWIIDVGWTSTAVSHPFREEKAHLKNVRKSNRILAAEKRHESSGVFASSLRSLVKETFQVYTIILYDSIFITLYGTVVSVPVDFEEFDWSIVKMLEAIQGDILFRAVEYEVILMTPSSCVVRSACSTFGASHQSSSASVSHQNHHKQQQ